MPYTTYNIPLPLLGINRDDERTFINKTFSPFMKNMVVESTRLRKFLGYEQLGSVSLPLTGAGMELINYYDARGNQHLIALTTTDAYLYNTSDDNWDKISYNIVLEDCEDVWTGGVGDTIASDAVDFKIDSASSKVTLIAGRVADNQLMAEDISSTDVSDYTHIGFWIKSSIEIAASDISIVVSEDNIATGLISAVEGTDYVRCSIDAVLPADTWTFYSIAKTLTNLDAVIAVGLYADDSIASGVVIRIDDIRAYTPFTGDEDDRWSHTVLTDSVEFPLNSNDALVISNGTADGIFFYEGQAADVFAELDTDVVDFSNAKEIIGFWNYFFFFNYNLGNQVVRSWKRSAVGDIDNFSGAGSAFGTYTDSIGKIVRAKKLGYDLIVYSDNSITTVIKSGGVVTFEAPTLVYETGLFAPKAIWEFVNVHYFIGGDQKFYGYSGGQLLEEIGVGIERTFFKELKMSMKSRITFGIDTNKHKLYCFYPDSSSDYGKKYYAYNYRSQNKSWEFGEFGHTVRDFSLFNNIIDLYCNSDSLAGIYCDESALYCDDSSSQSGYPLSVFIDHSGNVYKITESLGTFDGDQIDCEYQTFDFSIDVEQYNSRYAWVSFNLRSIFEGDYVAVQYAVDEDIDNENWTALVDSPIALTKYWKEHRLPLDAVGRRISFRLLQNDGSKDLQLRMTRISAMPLSEE